MKNLIFSLIVSILIITISGCSSSPENVSGSPANISSIAADQPALSEPVSSLASTDIGAQDDDLDLEEPIISTAPDAAIESAKAASITATSQPDSSQSTASENSTPTEANNKAASASPYHVSFPESQGSSPRFKIEVNADLTLPETVVIYQMVKPDITAEYVKELGDKLGISGEVKLGTESYLLSDDKTDASLEVYLATGTVAYRYPSGLYPKETPTLPSDEEASKIATDFLSELGILSENYAVSRVLVGGRSGETVTHLLVSFRSDIRTLGAGSKHSVRIGNNGEIVDLFYNPVDLQKLPVKEVSAKTLEQSLQDLEDSDECYYQAPDGTAKVNIESVILAYWLEPVYSEQEYIVPVYAFTGICYDADGNLLKGNYVGYIKAVD